MSKPLIGLLLCLGSSLATNLLSAQTDDARVLSLEAAVEQVLARNYTLQIATLDPEIAAQDARAARGGYDPTLSGTYSYEREETTFSGVDDETAFGSVGVAGELPWGTQYDASVSATDATSLFGSFVNPLDPDQPVPQILSSVSSSARIRITQPILRGFGRASRDAGVRLADNALAQAEATFRATVIDLVTETVDAYYDAIFAQENLTVALRNRDLAAQLLRDNRRRVETGALAPLDLVQAESEVALREVAVVSAEQLQIVALNRLRGLLFDDPTAAFQAPLSLSPLAVLPESNPDPQRDLVQALEHRPDYQLATLNLDAREIAVARDRRDALPELNVFGTYGRSVTEETLEDSLSELTEGQANYTVGAVVSMPLFNRSRDAARVRSLLQRNQADILRRQLEQSVLLELDNAAARVRNDWRRIQASQAARQLAERALEAEEKKLRAGTSSTFIVLRLQGDLANAEIREIAARADYATSLARYDQALGLTLTRRGIVLE